MFKNDDGPVECSDSAAREENVGEVMVISGAETLASCWSNKKDNGISCIRG